MNTTKLTHLWFVLYFCVVASLLAWLLMKGLL